MVLDILLGRDFGRHRQNRADGDVPLALAVKRSTRTPGAASGDQRAGAHGIARNTFLWMTLPISLGLLLVDTADLVDQQSSAGLAARRSRACS